MPVGWLLASKARRCVAAGLAAGCQRQPKLRGQSGGSSQRWCQGHGACRLACMGHGVHRELEESPQDKERNSPEPRYCLHRITPPQRQQPYGPTLVAASQTSGYAYCQSVTSASVTFSWLSTVVIVHLQGYPASCQQMVMHRWWCTTKAASISCHNSRCSS